VPEAGGRRVGLTQGHHFWQEYLDAIASTSLAERFPNATWGERRAREADAVWHNFENTVSREVLGIEYRKFEESAVDAAESILRAAEKYGWKL
jgi:hypothetical protein